MVEMASLLHLSADLMLQIFALAGKSSCDNFACVSRQANAIMSDDDLWQAILEKEWSGMTLNKADWEPVSSWRAVWGLMNRFGEYEGVYQLMEPYPYGLLLAVRIHQGALLCEALLPQGTAVLFQSHLTPAGGLQDAAVLPGTSLSCKGELRIFPQEFFEMLPSIHNLVCEFDFDMEVPILKLNEPDATFPPNPKRW